MKKILLSILMFSALCLSVYSFISAHRFHCDKRILSGVLGDVYRPIGEGETYAAITLKYPPEKKGVVGTLSNVPSGYKKGQYVDVCQSMRATIDNKFPQD